MQLSGLVLLASAALSTFWTANDPFVGKWKLDTAHSKAVDQMKIEAAGGNKYAFRFEGGPAENIVADGTDQPGVGGTTLAATIEDGRHWTIERKQDGHTTIVAHWNLSEDGRTLTDTFTSVGADGSKSTSDYRYHRTSGKNGVLGSWESTDPQIGAAYDLDIKPFGSHGLSFTLSVGGPAKQVTFDGQEHPFAGPIAGLTASGKRTGARVLEMTDKISGALFDTRTYEVSRDGKTLTMTMHKPEQSAPNVLVFERE
jgi:hypothetical protein